MKFLKTHLCSRPSTSNRAYEEEVINLSDQIEEERDAEGDCSLTGVHSQSIISEVEKSNSQTSQPTIPKTNTPDFSAPRVFTSARKRKSILGEQINGVKKLISKRIEEKSEYEWLSKQVEFEFKSIRDEDIRRETAWKIQTILREAVVADVTKRNYVACTESI